MPKCYMMIGIPGSGKSTYIQEVLKKETNLISISTDEYIEKIAKQNSSTYSAVYDASIKEANSWFNQTLKHLMSNSVDFIWDQTNINIKSRKFKLNQLIKHNYEIHAIAFDIQKDIIFDRLKTRENQTGKSIPESVIFSMINSYQPPSLEEGFQSVTIVDPFGITLSTGKKQSSLKI